MSTVQIKVASVDRTSAVLFSTAYFSSAVNGAPGEAKFRLRDPDRSLTVVPGSVIELLIDSSPVWYGFCTSAKRVYAFPAINVNDAASETRWIDVEATDLNVLFQKRIVFNQSAPASVTSPLYAAHTADTTALTALFASWLDLSGDGLDTSSGIVGVGDINEDQAARPWEGSDTWGQAVQSIALLPAAIFYLRPTKVFAYVDTDTPDAPFGLSDVPNHTTTKGYREMEILLDGSNLANDVMCWGIGYGSSVKVFKRDEDATSLSIHGRWQLGQVTYGIYKQATIDRVADSIINGSPEHHRGSKSDRPAVTLTTYEPGLLPAQKVNFESQVFGWSDVIPIRKMEVTFEAKDNPKYVLTLSHEIDTPWSFFDPWRFRLPPLKGSKWTPPNYPKPSVPACPPLCEQPTYRSGTDDYILTYPYVAGSLSVTISGSPVVITETDPAAGVFSYSTGDHSAGMVGCYTVIYRFDNFNRTVSGGWGTSDTGKTWSTFGSANVSGGIGSLTPASSAPSDQAIASIADAIGPTYLRMTGRVRCSDASADEQLAIHLLRASTTVRSIAVLRPLAVTVGLAGDWNGGPVTTASFAIASGSWYQFEFYWPGTPGSDATFTIWADGTSKPSSPTASSLVTATSYVGGGDGFVLQNVNIGAGSATWDFDYINFDYAGKPCYETCTVTQGVFVAAGVGGKIASSPDGVTWTLQSSPFSTTDIRGSAYSPKLGLFVLIGSAKIAYSTDGAAWTLASSPVVSGGLLGIAWSPALGLFVGVGSFQTVTSPDGIVWTLHSSVGGTTNFCIAWSPDLSLFAMGSSSGGLSTSPDGLTWTTRSSGFGSADIRAMAWGGGTFIAVGTGGTTSHSSDGVTWTAYSPTGPLDTITFTDIEYAPSLGVFVVAPGSSGKIVVASAPTTLTEYTAFSTPAGVGWDDVSGLWVAGGTSGRIYTSPDGVTWTSRTSPFGTSLIWTVVSSSVSKCIPVPPTPFSPGGPLFGPSCQVAVRTDSTHYQLGQSFVPNTSTVYVGSPGVLYARGTDYTEDPTGGIIIFSSPVADVRVYVCVFGAGPI